MNSKHSNFTVYDIPMQLYKYILKLTGKKNLNDIKYKDDCTHVTV